MTKGKTDPKQYSYARLRVLQGLCSSVDPDAPYALLLLPGIDGRNNKGSAILLKYLFMGSIGKDLVDASLDGTIEEVLSEMVLLIQESSVSVFWTNKARAMVGEALFQACPMLIEYISAVEDDVDMDLMQESKLKEFKRMILEAIPPGKTIGITLPIGYDALEEVEGWPLLQAFALDENVCSTGFLSARYTLVDVTESVDLIIKSVDGFVLENAIETVTKSVLPHVHQVLNILDTRSAEQRVNLTMSDLIAPLDILFDFGEIAAGFPVDPELRSTALTGVHSKYFGLGYSKFRKLEQTRVGSGPQLIIEGCEPSTGMRFCRTYFTTTGRSLPFVRDPEALTDDGSDSTDLDICAADPATERLRNLYFKLCCTLRWAVRATMAVQSDVYDVATEVRSIVDSVMKGKVSVAMFGDDAARHNLDEIRYSSSDGEELKVHIDCMNAFGQLVTIDDIDDMGGQSFVYIRLTLHNVPLDSSNGRGVIGVGDTFVFSPGYASLFACVCSQEQCMQVAAATPLSQDVTALTTVIPYHKYFMGTGIEEKSALKLLSNIRNTHMLPLLGLEGAIQDRDGSRGGLVIPLHLISDHPLMTLAHADVKAFQEGFVIDRLNTRCLPMLVSFKNHVKEVWSCDLTSAVQAAREFAAKDSRKTKVEPYSDALPSAVLMIIQMKPDHTNPLEVALPTHTDGGSDRNPVQHIAFVIPSNRSVEGVNGVIGAWRKAMRMHDIEEKRGVSQKDALPPSILRSLADAIGYWSMARIEAFSTSKNMPGMLSVSDVKTESLSELIDGNAPSKSWEIACDSGRGRSDIGSGYTPMLTTFSVAEARRQQLLSAEAYSDEGKSATEDLTLGNGVSVALVIGQPGSGNLAVASQIQERLNNAGKSGKRGNFQLAIINLSHTDLPSSPAPETIFATRPGTRRCSNALEQVRRCLEGRPKNLVLCITLNSMKRVEPASLFNLISGIGVNIAVIVSVINAKCALSPFMSNDSNSNELGLETWKACALEASHWGLCDYVLVVDEDGKHVVAQSAYAEICNLLQLTNPTLVNDRIHRIASGNTWLDPELIGCIERSFHSETKDLDIVLSESQAARRLRGVTQSAVIADFVHDLPTRVSCTVGLPGVVDLTTACIKIGGHRELNSVKSLSCLWDLDLLTTFLSWLFPRAKVCVSAAIGKKASHLRCVRGRKRGQSPWRRATDLAVYKAVGVLREKEGRRSLHAGLAGYTSSDFRVLYVHGIIQINRGVLHGGGNAQGSFESVSIEACAGSITIRPYALDVSIDDMNTLECFGLIDETKMKVLDELFSLCTIHELPRAQPPVRAKLPEKLLIELQKKPLNQRRALPNGWWFDGSGYFDVYGNRRVLRPDIDDLAEEYIQSCQDTTVRYNEYLDKGDKMLLDSL